MERTWPDSISFSPSSRICWWEKYWLLKLRVSPWQPSGNTRATATIHHLTGKEKWELNYWKAMTSIIKNDSSAIIYLFRMDPDRRKMRRRKGLVDWDTRSVCDERDSTCATSGRPDRWTRASPISPRSNFLFFFVAAACEWEELLPGSSSFFS